MKAARLQRHFVAVMAKHLPPSAARLRLGDLDGRCGALLREMRADIVGERLAAEQPQLWGLPPDSIDAVVAYDLELNAALHQAVLAALRPGGRFIAVQPGGSVSESAFHGLQAQGYVRVLVEAALDGIGVLLRGEKAHQSADTRQRIQGVAAADGDRLDLRAFKGRYVHLLVRQTPNKPVWKLRAGEKIGWQALALPGGALLGFSSLPKAVGFMQAAVLGGGLHGINKVGKFSRATALGWAGGVRLNPTWDALAAGDFVFVAVDPAAAEAADE